MSFFGDCRPRDVNREVFKDCNHPQNGNATHAVTLVWIEKKMFEPPSSSHWVLQSIFHVNMVGIDFGPESSRQALENHYLDL